MKIVYLSDLHLRPTAPINRKDDYVEEQFRKLDFVIDYANEVDGHIAIGGDLLDRATNHPSWFINRVMECLGRASNVIEIIPGNHDLLGHSLETYANNSIKTISYVDKVYIHTESHSWFGNVSYCPFGLTPPAPTAGQPNILVLHEPVFEDTVPFYMPDALTVEQLEAKYPGYDMYLAGDIHIPCRKSKTLVSGSMMRMTVAQKDHKPRFYVIDTETLEVETVFIPIKDDVWSDITEVVEDNGFKAELKDLALAMEERGDSLEYPKVVQGLSGDHWPKFDKLINEYNSKLEE